MINRSRPLSRILAALSIFSFLAAGATLACDEKGEDVAVELADSDCGSACVMVFGTVGEPFHVDLAGGKQARGAQYVSGPNALGEPCELPEGIAFDETSLSLEGVPSRPGFHEFVLLETKRGITTERVVLIDIQAPVEARSLQSYASYFLGGIR
ncbi:hypothetical protein [Pelagicoccus sp. SDUM812003]|uniref:hypothetical protein n=1 Tax=Pelagicoccus sp. SDUM812003 TaxID=3041267 RepID=UPI00280F4979|nr:hypothetical protein [Pelagicoccus sp. SDUM812003]MDQ8202518.1 hypothetical protein [Pelagicoccus sp. SDUM812003]